MEYLEGSSLSDLVKSHGPLPIADACELIRQAAVGLQHVHEHGLVHRDIKPSNVMLSAPSHLAGEGRGEGDKPMVKILDLGLALLHRGPNGGNGELTSTGQIMGTLDYMAPEQGGDSHVVDIRADIYSLGATLYKLLSGRPIYAGEKYSTPVNKIKALALEPAPSIQSRRSDVPDQLATIIHRMLAKAPHNRYATPAEVAEALAPFVVGANLGRLLGDGESADVLPSTNEMPSTATSLGQSAALHDTSTALPDGTPKTRDVSASPDVSTPDQTRIEPTALIPGQPKRRFWIPAAGVAVAVALVGIIALGVVFTINMGKTKIEIQLGDGVEAKDVRVAVTQDDRTVEIADAKEGWSIWLREGQYTLDLGDTSDTFDLDKRSIVVRRGEPEVVHVTLKIHEEADTTVKLAQTASRPANSSRIVEREFPPVTDTASMNSRALVTEPAELPGVQSWTIETKGHREPIVGLAYSPDGRLLASYDRLGTLRTWDASDHSLCRILIAPDGRYGQFAWSPDSSTIAVGGGSGMVQIWGITSGRRLAVFPAHDGGVRKLCWSPDGQLLATRGRDKTIRLWRWQNQAAVQERVLEHAELPTLHRFLPHGDKLLSVQQDHKVLIWDLASGNVEKTHQPSVKIYGFSSVLSSDGRVLAIAHGDGNIIGLDVQTGERSTLANLDEAQRNFLLSWSPDDKLLACIETAGPQKLILDPASGKAVQKLKVNHNVQCTAAWTPDGKILAVGGGGISIFRHRVQELLAQIPMGMPRRIQLSPDGHWRGSPDIEKELVYVVETGRGQETLTPDEFAKKYRWKNDPSRVPLVPVQGSTVPELAEGQSKAHDSATAVARQHVDAEPGPVTIESGQWIDVLRFVDPAIHTYTGNWQRDGDKLVVGRGEDDARILVPVEPKGSYQLRLSFVRTERAGADGSGGIGALLPVGDARNMLVLDNGTVRANGLNYDRSAARAVLGPCFSTGPTEKAPAALRPASPIAAAGGNGGCGKQGDARCTLAPPSTTGLLSPSVKNGHERPRMAAPCIHQSLSAFHMTSPSGNGFCIRSRNPDVQSIW